MARLLHRSPRATLALVLLTLVALGGSSYPALSSEGPAPAVAAVAGTQDQESARRPFLGSWRVLSFEARTASGQIIYPFGRDATGVLTYTPDGRMSGTLWKANRQPFASPDQQKGTPEEYTAAVQSYVQYVGTFDVDGDAGTVSHHIEQSIFPNWNGTTQTRFYAFQDHEDGLELATPPFQFGGTTIVAALVFERISAYAPGTP